MEPNLLKCGMCLYATINERVLLRHYVRNHQFDDRFYVMCNIDNCGATYKRWKSYKMHVYRKHHVNAVAEFVQIFNPEEPFGGEEPQEERHDDEEDPWESAQLQAAKFVLCIRDSCKTSDVARTRVMEGAQHLIESYVALFMTQIGMQADQETGMVSLHAIQAVLNETLPVPRLFSAVDTKSKLDSFLVEKFQMIMPQKVELGRQLKWKRKPAVDLIEDIRNGYIIPFLDSLKRLLMNDEVRFCVENPRNSNEVLRSILDGAYYKTHPFFSTNEKSLGIILYYDEVEIVNPLGSHTHKLGMFYWSLANIYPELRSSFNAVNLLGIARYCDLKKFGIDKMLEKFVSDLNTLQTEGVSVCIEGVPRTYKGSLLIVTADTPAAALLGGFKQSVSASKPCRRCMTTKHQLNSLFLESQFTLRNMETHLNHVEAVCNPNIQEQVRKFWQKFYGVNGSSPLLQVNGFDITKCLVQDIMHILSEGVLEVETRLLLKWCVDNQVLNLSDFNDKISLFDFGHLSKNKPSIILPVHLLNGLRQSAAQMVCLAYVVPFVIHDLGQADRDDSETHERLMCHNLLLQISNICFAFEVSNEDAHFLQNLIEIFLRNFNFLYPDAMVPKFHFLLHVPSQFIQFGPLRQQWCMRFEAVHAWFKSLARVVRSVKNIPWTLSYRHESLRCMQLNVSPDNQSTVFLCGGDMISEGLKLRWRDVDQRELELLLPLLPNVDLNNCTLMCTPKVVVHGTTYATESLVLLSCDEDDLPVFGAISKMYAHEQEVLLVILPYNTIGFIENVNAYRVDIDLEAEPRAILLKNLIFPHALSIFHSQGSKFVVLFNHARTEFVNL